MARGDDWDGAEVEVYRDTITNHFTTIQNRLIRNRADLECRRPLGPDEALTAVETKALIWLLTLPRQGFKTSRERMAEDFTEGVGQVRKALAGLDRKGYYRRTRYNDPRPNDKGRRGTFRWKWEASDRPIYLSAEQNDPNPQVTSTGQNPTNGPTEQNRSSDPLVNSQPMGSHPMESRPADTSSIEVTPSTPNPRLPHGSTGAESKAGEGADSWYDQAEEMLRSLLRPFAIGPQTRAKLRPAVVAAMVDGWQLPDLRAHLVAHPPAEVRQPAAYLAAKLRDLPDAPASIPEDDREDPWCGTCDPVTRRVVDEDGDVERRCPECHPRRNEPIARTHSTAPAAQLARPATRKAAAS